MQINPYGQEPGKLGVDLVNNPPGTAAAATRQCRAAGLRLPRPFAAAEHAGLLTFIETLADIVDAETPRARSARLNTLLEAWSGHPRLTDHNGTWHVHYRDHDAEPLRVVATVVSVGLAVHLSTRGMPRLGRCASTHDCTRAWIDTSRGGVQRFCSPACSNREAVRRHRAARS